MLAAVSRELFELARGTCPHLERDDALTALSQPLAGGRQVTRPDRRASRRLLLNSLVSLQRRPQRPRRRARAGARIQAGRLTGLTRLAADWIVRSAWHGNPGLAASHAPPTSTAGRVHLHIYRVLSTASLRSNPPHRLLLSFARAAWCPLPARASFVHIRAYPSNMGIAGLARRLEPYGARYAPKDLDGYYAIVDGPSLAYHAHQLALAAVARQSRLPSYADINTEAIRWLKALEDINIKV